jgi:hypothetical protein
VLWWRIRGGHDGTLITSTSGGSFLLPTADAESLLTALEPLARSTGLSDDRSAGQRRADALVEISEQVLRHGQLPDAGGLRPQLAYIVPAIAREHGGTTDLGNLVNREDVLCDNSRREGLRWVHSSPLPVMT